MEDPQAAAYAKANAWLNSQKVQVLITGRCQTSLGELQPGAHPYLHKDEARALMRARKAKPVPEAPAQKRTATAKPGASKGKGEKGK